VAKTGRNVFLLGQFKPWFKPCMAETCQPCTQYITWYV